MRWNQKTVIGSFQHDFKKVACIQPQDRAPVGFDISYLVKTGIEPLNVLYPGKKY